MSEPWAGRHLALVGLMGSGKSTVGAALADRLGRPFVDLDGRVEAMCGQRVAEVFADHGEEGFRARERDALRQVLAEAPSVVATGGGVVERVDNRALLRSKAWVVWLDVDPSTAAARVGPDPNRPLLGDDPAGALAALAERRRRLYRLASHQRVSASASTDEVVAAVLSPPSTLWRRGRIVALAVAIALVPITLLRCTDGAPPCDPNLEVCA